MVTDICLGFISLAFVILVIYLVITLCKVMKMLKTLKRNMINVDQLLKTTNDLALDIKEKFAALNVFFRPLSKLNKKKTDSKHQKYETIAEIIDFATNGMTLFKKLKKD